MAASAILPAKSALKEDPDGQLYRTGFFLGDGTGAGKGRQAAACILDQWLKGNRRHIWISKNAPLLEDAQRDWTAIGGLPSDILELCALEDRRGDHRARGHPVRTLRHARSSRVEDTRLDQIVRWAGEDFEGVIVFDEAHEMGGVAGGEGALGQKQGSLQGIAGVLLQNTLPRARVLYASATGASDVNNLAYAVRLGLWGPGTAFANREQFISEIRDGGIAAMELVARDLKASGLYLARALSFAGIEYDILRHDLTPSRLRSTTPIARPGRSSIRTSRPRSNSPASSMGSRTRPSTAAPRRPPAAGSRGPSSASSDRCCSR
jgi:hypothetical protein